MAENFASFDYKTQEEVLTVLKYLTSVLSTTGSQIVEALAPSHLLSQLHEGAPVSKGSADDVEMSLKEGPKGICDDVEMSSKEGKLRALTINANSDVLWHRGISTAGCSQKLDCGIYRHAFESASQTTLQHQ